MAYPLVEGNIGKYCILNGRKVDFDSAEGQELFVPTDDITYYESIRFQKGVLLFWEDHMVCGGEGEFSDRSGWISLRCRVDDPIRRDVRRKYPCCPH